MSTDREATRRKIFPTGGFASVLFLGEQVLLHKTGLTLSAGELQSTHTPASIHLSQSLLGQSATLKIFISVYFGWANAVHKSDLG